MLVTEVQWATWWHHGDCSNPAPDGKRTRRESYEAQMCPPLCPFPGAHHAPFPKSTWCHLYWDKKKVKKKFHISMKQDAHSRTKIECQIRNWALSNAKKNYIEGGDFPLWTRAESTLSNCTFSEMSSPFTHTSPLQLAMQKKSPHDIFATSMSLRAGTTWGSRLLLGGGGWSEGGMVSSSLR